MSNDEGYLAFPEVRSEEEPFGVAQMSAHPSIFVESYRPARPRRRARARGMAHGIGRDPHFGAGWWMIPVVTLGVAMWAGFFAMIL